MWEGDVGEGATAGACTVTNSPACRAASGGEAGAGQTLALPVPRAEEERRLDGAGVGTARDDLRQGTG